MVNYTFKGGIHINSPHLAEKLVVKQVPPPEQAVLLLQQKFNENLY